MNGTSDPIFKAVTWTILALLLTIIACFTILGNLSISIAVGLLSILPETLFYHKISYTRMKQPTIHRGKPNGSVEVLLVEFDRKNSHKGRAIEDRYVICPNEVITLEKTNTTSRT